MTQGNGAFDGAIAIHDGPAEGDGFGADGKAANRGAEVQTRPDLPVPAAQRCRDGMPERAIVPHQGAPGRFDQGVICGLERDGAG